MKQNFCKTLLEYAYNLFYVTFKLCLYIVFYIFYTTPGESEYMRKESFHLIISHFNHLFH